MKTYYVITLVGLPLLVVTGCAQSCSRDKPTPTPVPSVSASASASASSSVEAEPAHWEVLQTLPTASQTSYYSAAEAACLFIKARVPGQPWTMPYPYQVLITETKKGEYLTLADCGFFPTIQGSGWRTSYCQTEKGNERLPQQLFIMQQGDQIYVMAGKFKMQGFKEGPCP